MVQFPSTCLYTWLNTPNCLQVTENVKNVAGVENYKYNHEDNIGSLREV